MRLVFICFFAVLLSVLAACDNTTGSKNDTDTATDQVALTDDDQPVQSDQSDQSDDNLSD